jgi:hypothetical protein
MIRSHKRFLSRAFNRLNKDGRITSWHISLYMALFFMWISSGHRSTFAVSRRTLMQLSHIQSYVTYHKCIKQLHDFGYISYLPSYHPKEGSSISMVF